MNTTMRWKEIKEELKAGRTVQRLRWQQFPANARIYMSERGAYRMYPVFGNSEHWTPFNPDHDDLDATDWVVVDNITKGGDAL